MGQIKKQMDKRWKSMFSRIFTRMFKYILSSLWSHFYRVYLLFNISISYPSLHWSLNIFLNMLRFIKLHIILVSKYFLYKKYIYRNIKHLIINIALAL